MPSAGILPFAQTFICTFNNTCHPQSWTERRTPYAVGSLSVIILRMPCMWERERQGASPALPRLTSPQPRSCLAEARRTGSHADRPVITGEFRLRHRGEPYVAPASLWDPLAMPRSQGHFASATVRRRGAGRTPPRCPSLTGHARSRTHRSRSEG